LLGVGYHIGGSLVHLLLVIAALVLIVNNLATKNPPTIGENRPRPRAATVANG
jgi:hypothetical protein